jgi:TRAP transporter TAXI family solute receptor
MGPLLYPVFRYLNANQHRTFVISSGGQGGMYRALGEELVPFLDAEFRGAIKFKNETSPGSRENFDRVATGQAQIALAQDGIAVDEHVNAIARLFDSPLQIIAAKKLHIRDVGDLVGAPNARKTKVYIGAEGSGTRVIAEYVLHRYGLSKNDFADTDQTLDFAQATHELTTGKLDIAFFLVAIDAPALEALARDGGFAFLNVERADAIAAQYPFLKSATIPRASYASKTPFPDQPIHTVASREILICQSKLDEQTVYRITKAMFSHTGAIATRFSLMSQLSQLDQKDSVYYHLHPGAAAYFSKNNAPPIVSGTEIIEGGAYATTLLGIGLLILRRLRVRRLCEILEHVHRAVIDARHSLQVQGEGKEKFDARAYTDLVFDVRAAALRLYSKWRISEEAYTLVSEVADACLEEMAAYLSARGVGKERRFRFLSRLASGRPDPSVV